MLCGKDLDICWRYCAYTQVNQGVPHGNSFKLVTGTELPPHCRAQVSRSRFKSSVTMELSRMSNQRRRLSRSLPNFIVKIVVCVEAHLPSAEPNELRDTPQIERFKVMTRHETFGWQGAPLVASSNICLPTKALNPTSPALLLFVKRLTR